MMSDEVTYSAQRNWRQGTVTEYDLGVGLAAMRTWNKMVVMMKRPKNRTWMPKPASTTLLPRSWSFAVFALARSPPPIIQGGFC